MKKRVLAILFVFMGVLFTTSSRAEDEEAVSFGSPQAGESTFNPYPLERKKAWIALPAGMLVLLSLHLIAYPYLRVKKQKVNLESKKNEA